jgi:hypothetical protein
MRSPRIFVDMARSSSAHRHVAALLTTLFGGWSAHAAVAVDAAATDPLAAADVVWTSPSRDHQGSMPIGNGDLAANVWWNEGGELWMYLSKSDAWDDNGRLLKLGRVVVNIDPMPSRDSFSQRLNLRDGEIECSIGEGDDAVRFRIRADANRPMFVIEIDSLRPRVARLALEHWRTAPREVQDLAWSDVYCADLGHPGVKPTVTGADTVLPIAQSAQGAELVWFHFNERTPIPDTFELQGLESLLPNYHDPILHRAFGCLASGQGTVPHGELAIRSGEARRAHRFEIWARTERDTNADAFADSLRSLVRDAVHDAPAAALAAHRRWWNDFWNRSWIRVRERENSLTLQLPNNAHPVRVGFDSTGKTRFAGTIDRVLLFDRALNAAEIGSIDTGAAPDRPALEWARGDPDSIPDADHLDCTHGLTIAAWITPEQHSSAGGRILDKATVGASNGWLLDTYPGNSLRLIAGASTLTFDAALPPGQPAFVVGTYDAHDGRSRLYVGGALVAESEVPPPSDDMLNRAYALQRYLFACAGRGGAPIKFNGSLFTVPRSGHDGGDPDYRKWGPGYWFQNTRLIYWPLFASGDTELTEPFFAMYRDALPLAIARAQLVEGDRVAAGGATYHETLAFWGLPDNASFGWHREGAAPGEVLNPYIRHYRSGSIELLTMALERQAYRPDEGFFRQTLLPLADAFLAFYASYYPRNDDGTIRFEPAASLETWHDATDPLPEIAGLREALGRLLDPSASYASLIGEARRETWTSLLSALPPVPTGEREGAMVLLPAARFAALSNIENPELYAIFPYRLYGVGKPNLELARRTYALRANRNNVGWCQDSIQAAHLGLADEAASLVVRRARLRDAKSRFPAFWGPNYDWVPDQDHGANILTTVQSMLIQCDGRRITLLPAWPRGWDCDFRVHAPDNTVLTGTVEDGHIASLIVSPPERLADVTILRRDE